MIEIGIGVLLVAGALALVAGAFGIVAAPAGVDLFPLFGVVGTGLVLTAGLLLVAAGRTRRAIARHPERRHTLRSTRLTIVALLLVAGLAIALPLSPGPFNLLRIGGFPAGYYLAAQGGLIGLVILAFWWAARQNRIDAEEQGS
ncbi:MAG TPA: DUF4212 domain-containing protein [Hyphomicrobium sp.]|nr:DUF4212 domain-containing protein [Hyphomicrobium sp.]HRO49899.1 DUF4212 domain-containing protein [Hyphomicrobium sp.]